MYFELYEEMVSLEDQYFNINRILLLAIGLWPYEQSKYTKFQVVFFSSIFMTFIIPQIRKLLPILSKLFEKLLLPRLLAIIERQKIIPNHQFGFRPRHTTTEQIHRIIKKINTDMDEGGYCTAAFLDVSQVFDMACRSASQNQNLFSTRSIRNHKIVSSSKNLQG